MEMVDANKQIVGFDIDYLTAAAKEAGFSVTFKNTAWDGIFAGIEAGQYDIIASSVTITDERKKKYDFSAPYIDIGQILVVPKAEAAASLAGMKGKKVGAQIGTTGAFEVKKNGGVELKTYDEIGLAFEDMAAGRIAGVVCDEPTAVQFALQKAEYKEQIQDRRRPLHHRGLRVRRAEGQRRARRAAEQGHRRRQGQEARRAAAREVAAVARTAPGPA